MSVLAGLRGKDGYLFFIDDLTGGTLSNGGIVKLSNYCGALIMASSGQQLERLQEVLNRCITGEIGPEDDLSDNIIKKILVLFEEEFKNNSSYKTNPLTFLLLVIGFNRIQQGNLEYIYIRNRVAERIEKEGKREYRTILDKNPPVSADDIFFGDSGLIEYFARQLTCSGQPIDIIKLMACFSVTELNSKEISSLDNKIKMASLSPESGFSLIGSEEVRGLIEKTKGIAPMLKQGFNSFL